MKKVLEKDKKRRYIIKKYIEQYQYILKAIFNNFNFNILIRWKAFNKLKDLTKKNSRISLSSRCITSKNKKRFSKLTKFSRHIFLKLIRAGNISNLQKSSW